MTIAVPISRLPFAERFVSALPADRSTEVRPRQVHGACFSRVAPTRVAAPKILIVIPEVAALLGLDPTPTPELAAVLGGNQVVPGMQPYSACYGGHQFGTWAGQLGDGRAITLGEVVGPDGILEVQLKGAGPTPYSRTADGRAVMRSSLRELVCSEAMFHLGVPTTRALALVATGDQVKRDLLYDGHPRFEPGAITTRVAPSFLRFGNYELLASRDDKDNLEKLVRFTIDTYYPGRSIAQWFAEVADLTMWMIVEWMRVGFVHGVMNTDNMSILGLTIDYGPYGWLESFDPDWTPNTTDASNRRYRYAQQPQIAFWNLGQLARAIVRVVPDDEVPLVQRVLDRWPRRFSAMHRDSNLRKLGLVGRPDTASEDDALLDGLGGVLTSVETDMPLWFRGLARGEVGAAYYADPSPLFDDWHRAYRARAAREGISDAERAARMDRVNPLYVPRNYLVHEVIEAAERGDAAPLHELVEVLRRPYDEQPGRARFTAKRPEWARHKPGCSMLSCSS